MYTSEIVVFSENFGNPKERMPVSERGPVGRKRFQGARGKRKLSCRL